MFLTRENVEEINKLRRRIKEVSGIQCYALPLLEVKSLDIGDVQVWFATDRLTFVTLDEHGESVQEVESFEPEHWYLGPQNV